jgi:hypothetical protein
MANVKFKFEVHAETAQVQVHYWTDSYMDKLIPIRQDRANQLIVETAAIRDNYEHNLSLLMANPEHNAPEIQQHQDILDSLPTDAECIARAEREHPTWLMALDLPHDDTMPTGQDLIDWIGERLPIDFIERQDAVFTSPPDLTQVKALENQIQQKDTTVIRSALEAKLELARNDISVEIVEPAPTPPSKP